MVNNKYRILVLGASGMLGTTMVHYFSTLSDYEVFGASRSKFTLSNYSLPLNAKIIYGHDLENYDHLVDLFIRVKPNIVINCAGLVKQLDQSQDPILALPINSMLPHRLSRLSSLVNARLIHISTDCVFSGRRGMYNELDVPDALDVYGRSKLLGEVDYDNAITLRTSIIGHERGGNRSLVNWFLSQDGSVSGYTKAFFSGLPTIVIARLIHDHVVPNSELRGLYHVSSDPISKFDLLTLIAQIYNKKININPDDSVVIDRTLDSTRFRKATGVSIESWPKLVETMYKTELEIRRDYVKE